MIYSAGRWSSSLPPPLPGTRDGWLAPSPATACAPPSLRPIVSKGTFTRQLQGDETERRESYNGINCISVVLVQDSGASNITDKAIDHPQNV